MKIETSKLKNGIIVDTVSVPGTEALTILIMVRTGSRNETQSEAGLSHFLEHMFFKGTKNRPTTLIIATELDSLGAQYNAFTGKEYTGYWVKVSAKHYVKALDILSDMLLHPLFEEAEMEKEKGAVIQEINMYEDSPKDYVGVLFEEDFFGKNALGRSIAGSRESVAAITHEQLIFYAHRFYIPSEISIVIAGAMPKSHEKAVKEVEEKFGGMERVKKSSSSYANLPTKTPKITAHHKKTEQTNLVFGLPALPYKDKRAELAILSAVLGGNMSSKLFIEVRERRGLAYYIYSWIESFHETGFLGIHTGIDNSRVTEAVEVIFEETRKLAGKISDDEIKRAKEYLIGSIILRAESSYFVAEETAKDRVYHLEPTSIEEKIKKIEKVKASEVKSITERLLNGPISMSLIGPFKDKEPFVKILEEK